MGQKVQSPKRKSRFLRLSLRSTVVLATILCIVLAMYTPIREQQEAVRRIQNWGGTVLYDYHYVEGKPQYDAESPAPKWLISRLGPDYFHRVKHVGLTFLELRDRNETGYVPGEQSEQLFRTLVHLPHLESLQLHCPKVRDESLRHLASLPRLRRLSLMQASEVTDRGIAQLAQLPGLENLLVTDAKITDEAMRLVSALPRLRVLNFQHNQFTDAALSHVPKMTTLEFVSFVSEQNEFTDQGIRCLSGVHNLKILMLGKTQASSESLQQLESQLPGCWFAAANSEVVVSSSGDPPFESFR